MDELVCSPYRSDSSSLSMKSKLAIIAVLATIAITGVPLQAVETEITRRGYAIAGVVYAQCDVAKGLLTQEQADGTYRDSIKYYP